MLFISVLTTGSSLPSGVCSIHIISLVYQKNTPPSVLPPLTVTTSSSEEPLQLCLQRSYGAALQRPPLHQPCCRVRHLPRSGPLTRTQRLDELMLIQTQLAASNEMMVAKQLPSSCDVPLECQMSAGLVLKVPREELWGNLGRGS